MFGGLFGKAKVASPDINHRHDVKEVFDEIAKDAEAVTDSLDGYDPAYGKCILADGCSLLTGPLIYDDLVRCADPRALLAKLNPDELRELLDYIDTLGEGIGPKLFKAYAQDAAVSFFRGSMGHHADHENPESQDIPF